MLVTVEQQVWLSVGWEEGAEARRRKFNVGTGRVRLQS